MKKVQTFKSGPFFFILPIASTWINPDITLNYVTSKYPSTRFSLLDKGWRNNYLEDQQR